MDAMLIVDMQVGLLNGEPKHDLRGVIDRINRLAARVREQVGHRHLYSALWRRRRRFRAANAGLGVASRTGPRSRRPCRSEADERPIRRRRATGTSQQDRAGSGAGDRLGYRPLCRCDRPIRRLKPSQRRRGDRRPYIERPPSPRCARRDPASPLGLEPSHHPKTGQARNDRRAAGLKRMTRPVRA